MRVALVLYGDLEFISGGFLYDRLLVDYLRRQGEEVEIVPLPWPSYARGLLDNFSPALKRRLAGIRADVILQDELAHPSLFRLNRQLRAALPCPVIAVVLHLRSCEEHPPWKMWLHRGIERQYLASVSGFICISEAIHREVIKLGGDGRPWVVAYPGGDRLPGTTTREDIAKRALQAGPLEIASIANLIPRKGLHTLISALAYLPRGQWRLRVAGNLTDDPAYVQSLRRHISKLGVEQQVTLLGTQSAGDLSALLAQSHIMAVPAAYEALGIVHLEAMRAGLPVIASTAGGAREICTHGREGFLVAPGDVGALIDSLQLLFSDRKKLLAMSLAAWERSRTHPTWEDTGAAVHGFLKSLTA